MFAFVNNYFTKICYTFYPQFLLDTSIIHIMSPIKLPQTQFSYKILSFSLFPPFYGTPHKTVPLFSWIFTRFHTDMKKMYIEQAIYVMLIVTYFHSFRKLFFTFRQMQKVQNPCRPALFIILKL